jgi:phage terminase small subunit
LNKLEVQLALDAAFAARSKRVQIDQDAVVRELAAIATADVRTLFTQDGALRPIHDLPEEVAGAIASLQISRRKDRDGLDSEIVYKLRFWDKVKALELLGRHLGMFSDQAEETGTKLGRALTDLTDEELIERLLAKRRPPLTLTAVPRLVASNPTPEPRAAALRVLIDDTEPDGR